MDAPVIIVGAGPVGLSLALGLARYRVRSILFERNAEPVPESRALIIWPRTLEIMRDWGAYDALRAEGTFLTRFKMVNAATGRQLICVDFRNVEDIVEDPGILVLPQSDTERILRDLVNQNPYCELRTGAEVTAIEQQTQYVDAKVKDANGETTVRGTYLIGCDGAHGLVRHAMGLTLEGVTYDARVLLSDEIVDRDIRDDETMRVFLDQPGFVGGVRFGPRAWRMMTLIGKDADDATAMGSASHDERLHKVFGCRMTSRTTWTSIFKIHRRHAQRFVIGRVALAGDAAHVNSPAGGQGMNSGIHDAANLAWKLSYILNGAGDCASLFESYDIERREMVTDTIERYTDRLTRMGLTFPPRARAIALRLFSRAMRGVGMQRKVCRALGMLSGRYTKSPIVDTRHPLAGKRIPDLLLPDGERINRLRNGNPAVVLAGDADMEGLPVIRIPAAPKRWHVKLPVALIVRPDGCVAAVVEKPTRANIETAWNRAFCDAVPLPERAVAKS